MRCFYECFCVSQSIFIKFLQKFLFHRKQTTTARPTSTRPGSKQSRSEIFPPQRIRQGPKFQVNQFQSKHHHQ